MTMSAHIYRYGQIDYDLDSGMRQNDNHFVGTANFETRFFIYFPYFDSIAFAGMTQTTQE